MKQTNKIKAFLTVLATTTALSSGFAAMWKEMPEEQKLEEGKKVYEEGDNQNKTLEDFKKLLDALGHGSLSNKDFLKILIDRDYAKDDADRAKKMQDYFFEKERKKKIAGDGVNALNAYLKGVAPQEEESSSENESDEEETEEVQPQVNKKTKATTPTTPPSKPSVQEIMEKQIEAQKAAMQRYHDAQKINTDVKKDNQGDENPPQIKEKEKSIPPTQEEKPQVKKEEKSTTETQEEESQVKEKGKSTTTTPPSKPSVQEIMARQIKAQQEAMERYRNAQGSKNKGDASSKKDEESQEKKDKKSTLFVDEPPQ
ncbi:MAG: hypothetical protein ACRCYZ_06400 [Alphaproteobacteria bacterium]